MEECGEAPGQTGTKGAARMAREAEVEKLILVHRGPGLERDESEARARSDGEGLYEGEVILADGRKREDEGPERRVEGLPHVPLARVDNFFRDR